MWRRIIRIGESPAKLVLKSVVQRLGILSSGNGASPPDITGLVSLFHRVLMRPPSYPKPEVMKSILPKHERGQLTARDERAPLPCHSLLSRRIRKIAPSTMAAPIQPVRLNISFQISMAMIVASTGSRLQSTAIFPASRRRSPAQ